MAFKETTQTGWMILCTRHPQRFDTPLKLNALEKIDLVDQLQTWLEANGIESAWELAPAMVNFGWDSESLEKLKGAYRLHCFHFVFSGWAQVV